MAIVPRALRLSAYRNPLIGAATIAHRAHTSTEHSVMAISTKRRPHGDRSGQHKAIDAVALLKADHREVEDLFEQFAKSRSGAKKGQLAADICSALTIHAQIEEEIFYPAFLEATDHKDMHHEAIVEHEGAKRLIAELDGMKPEDDYFDARVTVLSEMIKHHVKEEEKAGGMFAEAKKSKLDLKGLGEQMSARKMDLQSNDRAA
jgi:hemerythrin superfamily protein